MVAVVLKEGEWSVVECEYMKLRTSIESGEVCLFTDGVVA